MNTILKKTIATILLIAMLITHTPVYVIAAADTTPPSVVVSGLSSSTVAYKGETMSFKVYFSDETEMGEVTLTKNHVMLIGFTGDISVSGSGNTRTVTISNVNDNSTTANKVTIRANAAKDAAGNTSKVFTSSAFTITERPDTTKPSVVVSKPSVSTVTEGGSLTYTVSFADNKGIKTNNFSASYVSLTGFDATVSVSGSGNTRTVTLSNITGAADSDNKISIRANAVKDAAGNGSSVVTSTAFTIKAKDTTRPSVVISKPSPTTVEQGGTVKYTVSFSDETAIGTVNFNADYVALVGFTGNVSVSGTGNTRYVTISNVTGTADADNKITIRANAAKDSVGNGTVATNSTTFTIVEPVKDTTRPSVVISKPSPMSVTEGGTVKYTVSFSDETAMGTINFNKDYVALIGFTANVSVSGTGNTRTVTLSNITGAADSNNKITIRANAAKDAAGNGTVATNSTTFTIVEQVKDTTRPSVVISKPSPLSVEVGGTVE